MMETWYVCVEWFCGLPFFILVNSSYKMLNSSVWSVDYCHYLSMAHNKLNLCKCMVSHLIVSWDLNNLFWHPRGFWVYEIHSGATLRIQSSIQQKFIDQQCGRLCARIQGYKNGENLVTAVKEFNLIVAVCSPIEEDIILSRL